MQPVNGKSIAAMMSPRAFGENFMMGSLNKVSKRYVNVCLKPACSGSIKEQLSFQKDFKGLFLCF
jgi:hypothetical protein